MPQPPNWKRVLVAGLQFAPLRGGRQFAAGLVAQAEQARDQLGTIIGELFAAGRHRNADLGRIVRSGAEHQLAGLGLVTKTELVRFERRMRPAPAAKTAEAKKQVTATRDGARKSPTASARKRER